MRVILEPDCRGASVNGQDAFQLLDHHLPAPRTEQLKEDFVKKHGETAKTAAAGSLQKTFG